MTKKILLIIKSHTYHQVKLEAEERGIYIPSSEICSLTSSQFRARVDEKYLRQIQHWFNEPSTPETGFGYPIGTLLFYKSQI